MFKCRRGACNFAMLLLTGMHVFINTTQLNNVSSLRDRRRHKINGTLLCGWEWSESLWVRVGVEHARCGSRWQCSEIQRIGIEKKVPHRAFLYMSILSVSSVSHQDQQLSVLSLRRAFVLFLPAQVDSGLVVALCAQEDTEILVSQERSTNQCNFTSMSCDIPKCLVQTQLKCLYLTTWVGDSTQAILFVFRLQSQGCVWTPNCFFSAQTQRKASRPWGDILWLWQSVLD